MLFLHGVIIANHASAEAERHEILDFLEWSVSQKKFKVFVLSAL